MSTLVEVAWMGLQVPLVQLVLFLLTAGLTYEAISERRSRSFD